MKLNKILYWVILGMTSVGFKYCMAAGEGGTGDEACDETKTPGCGHVPDDQGLIGGKKVTTNTPPAGETPPDTAGKGKKDLKGSELIKLGCIFNERTDLGLDPFSKTKKDDDVCEISLKEETDAFMYACDGTSEPADCPVEVKVEEGVVRLDTLFTQATITDQSTKYTGNPKVFHVVTGKAHKNFEAVCECTRADGKKDTMKLKSSFKQVGILGVMGLVVLILMK